VEVQLAGGLVVAQPQPGGGAEEGTGERVLRVPVQLPPAGRRDTERLAQRRRERREHPDAGAARLVVPAGLARLRPFLSAERLRVGRPEQRLCVLGGGTFTPGPPRRRDHARPPRPPGARPGPPARALTPARVPSPARLIAMTVSCRDRDTPSVVSEFAAQRRFAEDVSSAITTQSSQRAAARARSTVSCGVTLPPRPC